MRPSERERLIEELNRLRIQYTALCYSDNAGAQDRKSEICSRMFKLAKRTGVKMKLGNG